MEDGSEARIPGRHVAELTEFRHREAFRRRQPEIHARYQPAPADTAAEEEVELATRIRAGRRAEEASAGLLAANQWLVVSLAERYTGRGMPLGDLVRQGNVGLNLAIQRYDPAQGYRFATFATWWVRQAIMRTVAGQRRGDDGLTRTERQVLEVLGREPTPEELAAELD